MAPKTWSLTKEQARYRPAAKPEFSCQRCQWMFPRASVGSCKFIFGLVRGSDTCDEFEPHRRPR